MKRKVKPTRKFLQSSDDESETELQRPPPIKKPQLTGSAKENIRPSSSFVLGSVSSTPLCSPNSPAVLRANIDGRNVIATPATQRLGTLRYQEDPPADHFQFEQPVLEKLVTLVSHVKQQNDRILAWIATQESGHGNVVIGMPEIPYEFPLKTIEELDDFNIYITHNNDKFAGLVSYFGSLGGRTATNTTNRIFKKLLLDSVTINFSYYGQRSHKRAFSELRLKDLITDSVKKSIPNTTNKEVEDLLKIWLKHAPERLKKKS